MKKREVLPLCIILAALLPALVLPKTKPEQISSTKIKPSQEDLLLRTFNWTGADKKSKRVSFSLSKSRIKSELNKFGVLRGQENALLLQKKGFKHVGISKGLEVYMVNYLEIFLRNLEYFQGLTQVLYDAMKPQPPERQLMEFLFFVQAITYKKPPFYYHNKFINSFFPPLICLYEQSGDCDSKSILLAEFLTCHNNEEKTALLFINHLGLKHSILLVKRTPSPGMSGIFIKGKGYYIPLEASSPGWAPGFVNQRIWNAITTGNFRFSELQ